MSLTDGSEGFCLKQWPDGDILEWALAPHEPTPAQSPRFHVAGRACGCPWNPPAVALEDTLAGKLKARRTPERRPSKAIKDLGDTARLIEAHPALEATLPADGDQAIRRERLKGARSRAGDLQLVSGR